MIKDNHADFENPWTSKDNLKHVDADDNRRKRQEQELEAREQLINALPVGSLSNNRIVFDIDDKATWYLSDDPKLRELGTEFYGAKDPLDTGYLPNEGLSYSEKKVLHQAGEKEVYGGFDHEGVHHDGIDFRQADKDQRDLQHEAAAIWPEYALKYGDLAADKAGAAQAMKYLVDNSGLSKRDLVNLARGGDRERILDAIAEAQYNIQISGSGGGSRAAPARQGYTEDDHRTMVQSGSYSTGHVVAVTRTGFKMRAMTASGALSGHCDSLSEFNRPSCSGLKP